MGVGVGCFMGFSVGSIVIVSMGHYMEIAVLVRVRVWVRDAPPWLEMGFLSILISKNFHAFFNQILGHDQEQQFICRQTFVLDYLPDNAKHDLFPLQHIKN